MNIIMNAMTDEKRSFRDLGQTKFYRKCQKLRFLHKLNSVELNYFFCLVYVKYYFTIAHNHIFSKVLSAFRFFLYLNKVIAFCIDRTLLLPVFYFSASCTKLVYIIRTRFYLNFKFEFK